MICIWQAILVCHMQRVKRQGETCVMKKAFSNLILILVFFVGLSVLLYPTVSNYWNSRTQSRAIVDYEATLGTMNEEDFSALFAAADEYNRALREITYPLMNYDQLPGYDDLLDVGGNGIIGQIHIEKINVDLPIYHGTSNDILNVAVGHLEGTSLPVGGSSTHSVLSAHRGLPSAKLFSELDKLVLGDIFTIEVLDRVLTYQVDQIRIVKPTDVDDLSIFEGEDYCTLLTCTPYGINTHRLLVRGTRIAGDEVRAQLFVPADAYKIDPLIVAPVIAVPVLLMLLVYLLVKYRKH